MNKKFILFSSLSLIALPNIVFAAEKSAFHIFYERTFGPIGAIAGIIAMIVLWQLAKKIESRFSSTLKMFVLVLLFINIGSISFGIHGGGILSGEMSRYIERICRLIALLIADIAALKLYLDLTKDKSKNIN